MVAKPKTSSNKLSVVTETSDGSGSVNQLRIINVSIKKTKKYQSIEIQSC